MIEDVAVSEISDGRDKLSPALASYSSKQVALSCLTEDGGDSGERALMPGSQDSNGQ